MITVSAYNPAKSPITFQKSNNKLNNTQLLKSGAPSEVQATKASRKSLGAMFRRLALPVLTALSVAACTPEDLPDVPVNPIDTTSMSETQKQTGLIINSMYGTGEDAVNKGAALRSAADPSIYQIPDTLVTESGGVRYRDVFDKSNPDTIKSVQTIFDAKTGKNLGSINEKYYLDATNTLIRQNKFAKMPLTVNLNGNVVMQDGVSILEYIKKDNVSTIEKYVNTGAETLIKVIKKI